ncbi:MAG: lysophospholipid acyltransferase family protein [Wenzhouxiangellaceae bacterium]|nr:lysophospholipid acyltransferase family protein [Wenzhouxiangellaceae bacterium]
MGAFQPWRLVYRLPALLLLLVAGLPLLLAAKLPLVRAIGLRGQPLERRVQRLFARLMVASLGMRFRLLGRLPQRPYLLVANHISWFDIVLLHAAEPMWLVAKHGIRDWFGIGAVAHAVGTIFIERGSEASRRRVSRRMAALLRRGMVVGVFPEGGIHPDRGVKRFHARLFAPATRAGVSVVPVAIRYWRDGDIHDERVFGPGSSFGGLLFSMLARPACEGQVIVGRPLSSDETGRTLLARQAQLQVQEMYEHVER